ncbi:hypothetical protein ACFB49_43550 [Sphingomonas sp. DBB INV C78]
MERTVLPVVEDHPAASVPSHSGRVGRTGSRLPTSRFYLKKRDGGMTALFPTRGQEPVFA